MISIDKVIEQNIPQLDSSPRVKKVVKKGLDYLLHEQEFIDFEKNYPHLQGIEFIEQVLEEFEFNTHYKAKQLEHIPNNGPLVIVANHPIGSLDALALIALLAKVRSDIKVVANRLLMSLKPLHSHLLPVDNMSGTSLKTELQNIHRHLKHQGALLIFPAGEVSRLSPMGIKDGKWNPGFLRMAKRANASVIPVHIKAKNSPLFYGTSMIYKPMASLLLVNEMFKHKRKALELEIGAPIPSDSYRIEHLSDQAICHLIKKHLYRLGSKKDGLFKTEKPIALPECRQALKSEIESCELLGKSQDNISIYLYRYNGSSAIFRELGRLREIAFRAVGEGTGKRRDIDKFDMDYQHLILWDANELELAGAYRLADTKKLTECSGIDALYTDTLFDYNPAMAPYFEQGLELGRSFVQPKYWGLRSLDYLWFGIGAFVSRYPQYRYLFGPVSVSNSMPETAKALLVYFYQHYFSPCTPRASAKRQYKITQQQKEEFDKLFAGNDQTADFKQLKSLLATMGAQVPTLFKQYSEVCEQGGVTFESFSLDPDFNYCIDALVLVDLHKLKPKKAKRYLNPVQ